MACIYEIGQDIDDYLSKASWLDAYFSRSDILSSPSGRKYYGYLVDCVGKYRARYHNPFIDDIRLAASKFTARDEVRERILLEYGDSCLSCRFNDTYISLDHVIPISVGGYNLLSNLQPLCSKCNSRKGSTIKDFRPYAAFKLIS